MRAKAIIFLLLLFALPLSAQDISSKKARKANLEREIAEINRKLSATRDKEGSAESSLMLIRRKIDYRREMINSSDRKIKVYGDMIDDTKSIIRELQAKEDTLSSRYSRLISVAYRNRDPRIWYMYILSSENMGQAFRRYMYFRKINSGLSAQAALIRQTRDSIQTRQEALAQLMAQSRELRDVRMQEVLDLQSDERDAQEMVTSLKKESAVYEKRLAEKKRQVSALNREIQRMLSDAMKGAGSRKPADKALTAEFSGNMGRLPWPVDGTVVETFGEHYHPVFTKVKLPFNNGITISVKPSAQVKSVFNGIVRQIVVMPGYNQCILVQHGEYFTFYCKLSSCNVKAGDKVRTGQVLGEVDTINGDTQLHFQIWQGQKPQNPEVWLR